MTDTSHPLHCRCGTLQGRVDHPHKAISRGVCYCRDCQAYARVLGDPGDVLDAMGGTDVVATFQRHVAFTAGLDALACLSLTPRGLLRWYARCCDTPIGNTTRNRLMPYIGVVHTCLGSDGAIGRTFGPVRMRVNTATAKGNPGPMRLGTLHAVGRFAVLVARARLSRAQAPTPFFTDDARPVVEPRIVGREERERAMAAL
jgi:Family of unknown function (DUF6151)